MLLALLSILIIFSFNPGLHQQMMMSGWPSQDMSSIEELDADENILGLLEESIAPVNGIDLPVHWNGLGQLMVEVGVIDAEEFAAVYSERGGLSDYEKALLVGNDADQKLFINPNNSGVVLNLLWALGLANKSSVLEKGPMVDPEYGGAEVFASTGGWTLAKGDVLDHYNAHALLELTPRQEKLVEQVAKNVFRPCCNNSTYFPDCNHGMAMLGLLQLMASQDVSEQDMYKYALQVNSYWFPDTYLTIGKFFAERDVEWSQVDPSTVLAADYSSSTGYGQILDLVEPVESSNQGGCAV